jgi:hypothetical protein
MRHVRKLVVLAAVVALISVACGDGDGTAVPSDETLPPGPSDVESPPDATGACLDDEPICDDVPGVGAEPLPLDAGSDGGDSGLVVDGALTVGDALAAGASEVIAVLGFVVQDDLGIRLCEALAESMPPQCGGASIEVANLDTVDPDELVTAQGVTWTDLPVTIIGQIVDGVLVPEFGS